MKRQPKPFTGTKRPSKLTREARRRVAGDIGDAFKQVRADMEILGDAFSLALLRCAMFTHKDKMKALDMVVKIMGKSGPQFIAERNDRIEREREQARAAIASARKWKPPVDNPMSKIIDGTKLPERRRKVPNVYSTFKPRTPYHCKMCTAIVPFKQRDDHYLKNHNCSAEEAERQYA